MLEVLQDRRTPLKEFPPTLRSLSDLKPGDHLCGLFETEEEHRALLTPFLRQGLGQNEKVLYIADAHSPEQILNYLRDAGLDVMPFLAAGQLRILSVEDFYLRSGRFDPDAAIALLRSETQRALAEGFSALRATGEMSWALKGGADYDRLIEYEAKLNHFFPGSRCLALCQYDCRCFPPALLLDVLATHPLAVLGTTLYDNSYFLPPKMVLEHHQPSAMLRNWLNNLATRRSLEESLRGALEQSGHSQTEVASVLTASRALLEVHEFKEAAHRIFVQCKKLIGATGGYVALLSKDGTRNEVLFLDTGGQPCTVDTSLPMPVRGLRAEAYRAGRAVFDNDFSNSEWARLMPAGHLELQSVLFAPLVLDGKGHGILGLANKPGGFDDHDARLAGAFGVLAAVALLNSRTLESLESNERRFRSVVQTACDAIINVDSGGDIVFWNRAAETMFGYTAGEMMGRPLTTVIPARFREAHERGMKRLVSTGESRLIGRVVEVAALRRDGSEFPIELSLAFWTANDEKFFTGIVRDISERRRAGEALRQAHDELEIRVEERTAELASANQALHLEIIERSRAEERVRRLNHVYSVLSDINQAIVRVRDRQLLLHTACRIAVEKGLFRLAWIGIADNGASRFRPAASYGADEGFLDTICLCPDGVVKADCLAGLALHEGRSYVCNDVEHEAPTAHWRDEAIERGYRSVASFPLIVGGRVTGVFNLCAAEPQFFDSDEIRLLEEMAADISLALESMDQAERRRHAEEMRRSAEARFQRVFQSSMIGLAFWKMDGCLTEANDAFLRLIGYSREELRAGKVRWQDITPPEFTELDNRALEEVRATGVCTPFEKEYIRKDGARVRILLGAALLAESGAEGVAFALDLSERLLLEEQLRQAQKLEAIGRLAGGVAHDFNNVLGVILGYGEMLLERLDLEDSAHAAVQEIKRAAERAVLLTRQLLAFSRKQVLRPRVLDLNQVLADLEKTLPRLVGEDVYVSISPGAELGRVEADPGQIEQVIMNLAANARDAMPTGGRLTVETANVELGEDYVIRHTVVVAGRYVMLAVSDTGAGMDRETQERIFEPFFTTKEQGQGTGLGLATVYGIVKQSGGYIWVYSEPGHGTTFKIYLPRVDAPIEDQRSETESALPRGSETILVVEDEDSLRSLLSQVLEAQGYTALVARNGAEAVEMARRYGDSVRLVLTDVVMPEMSGRELATRLAESSPKLKVLFMSGYTDDAILRHGILQPEIAFLQKPFKREALVCKVREILDSPKPPTPSA
ncbi:MAG: MEDS domain-containing protein [Acidobacteria bacterium]|nr:MEDS domain-containing protein [Acidobacteriota bacterium]MBI3661892.1 MEDS domain-containing protein [Acidobacteriota bacterium]